MANLQFGVVLLPIAKNEEYDANDRDRQADQLRCRKSGGRCQSPQVAARVVTDEFDQETEYCIDDAVGYQYLSVKFLAAMKPYEQAENGKHRE